MVPVFAILCFALGFWGCGEDAAQQKPFAWNLPAGFPMPRVPADNPMSEAKVELGRRLFYDKKLSLNETQSCASCHIQALAFTDGRTSALGSTGEMHRRNAQGLANVAYVTALTWANPLVESLETQALLPIFGETPIELGFSGREDELIQRLSSDADYASRFRASFPEDAPSISMANVTRAIGAFQRTLLSGNSPYDRFTFQNEATAMSEAAKRGQVLFFSHELQCDHCHTGFQFADSVAHEGTAQPEKIFNNTGLYNEGGTGAYPSADPGVVEVTHLPEDMGRFRAPSLRNVAVTAPYMHDGSIATLGEVIDHYAAGGRARAQNGGQASPFQSEFVQGFAITDEEKAELIAFLESLTDEAFLKDSRFSNPFEQP
jgi:cytochrome c peroxidase